LPDTYETDGKRFITKASSNGSCWFQQFLKKNSNSKSKSENKLMFFMAPGAPNEEHSIKTKQTKLDFKPTSEKSACECQV